MYFDDKYIETLSSDPEEASKRILADFNEFHQSLGSNDEVNHYDDYVRAVTLLKAFAQTHGIQLVLSPRSKEVEQDIKLIIQIFQQAQGPFAKEFAVANLDKFKESFERKFNKGFHFKFSDGDLKRIQILLNELRDTINMTEDLDDDHRSRLLKRLEKLQSELHKTVSDLDRFWGLLVDGSIVMKKVGINAKPIVDRIQEIVNIVWRVQARAEELPSNAPLELPSVDKEE